MQRQIFLSLILMNMFVSPVFAINLDSGFDKGKIPANQITPDCSQWTNNLSCAQGDQQAVDNVVDQLATGGGGSGTVTSVGTISPLTGGPITTTGNIGINTTGTWNGNAVTSTNSTTTSQIGTLTNTDWCTSNGSTVSCTSAAPTSTAPGGGANAVQYNSSPTGTFNGAENVFSFNGTNVGIGTTNGIQLLDVDGTITRRAFEVSASGNVGIGTSANQAALSVMSGNVGIGTWNPTNPLSVVGAVNATGNISSSATLTGTTGITCSGSGCTITGGQGTATISGSSGDIASSAGETSGSIIKATGNNLTSGQAIFGQSSSSSFTGNLIEGSYTGTDTGIVALFQSTSASASGTVLKVTNAGTGNLATLTGTGNFGIGSLTPGQKLDVQGTVRALSSGTCTLLYQCVGGVDAGVIQTSACNLCPSGSCVAMNGCF